MRIIVMLVLFLIAHRTSWPANFVFFFLFTTLGDLAAALIEFL